MVAIPVYVRHNIIMKNGTSGRLELTVGPKQSMGKMVISYSLIIFVNLQIGLHFQLEEVIVEMNMPKPVQNCNLVASQGKYSFEPTTKLMQWNIGKIEHGKPPTLKGTMSISGTADLESPPINVKFRINQLAVSGLKVNRLDVSENLRCFKGVKYVTKAGKFQVRT